MLEATRSGTSTPPRRWRVEQRRNALTIGAPEGRRSCGAGISRGQMTVLRSRTIVVLIRASLGEPRAAAGIARWGLHETLLMVRTVSPVLRLSRRRTIVRKSRTIKPSRDRPTARRGEGHDRVVWFLSRHKRNKRNALERFAAALTLGNALADNAHDDPRSRRRSTASSPVPAGLRGAYERATNTRLVERPPITETLERRRWCWR